MNQQLEETTAELATNKQDLAQEPLDIASIELEKKKSHDDYVCGVIALAHLIVLAVRTPGSRAEAGANAEEALFNYILNHHRKLLFLGDQRFLEEEHLITPKMEELYAKFCDFRRSR